MKKVRIAITLLLLSGLFALMAPPANAVTVSNAQVWNDWSGLCLSQSGYHVNGATTRLSTCSTATATQRWYWLLHSGGDYKRLFNSYTHSCLNGDTSRAWGNYPCSLGAPVEFVVITGTNAYMIRSVYYPAYCLAAGHGYPLAWYGCDVGWTHYWWRVRP